MTPIHAIVIHYDEIALKGKNRTSFENLLIQNIRLKLGPLVRDARREAGQLTFETAEAADPGRLRELLACVPGIAYFSFAHRTGTDVETLRRAAVEFVRPLAFHTFKVDTRRHEKNLPYTSMELSAQLGADILDALPDRKVKMENPDLLLKVEVTHKAAYLSAGNVRGVGGFPTDPRQKVVSLLSGGFDSPVASYLMMKRGCEVVMAHFLNENSAAADVRTKVTDLARRLARYQRRTRLWVVDFSRIQNEIIMKTPAPVRMLVYRQFMMRISARIARDAGASFLVVGDSLSQVASQTLDNLRALYETSPLHVLSPLIGFDKREIIALARQIGTFDLSSRACPDLCSFYLPKHPALRATRQQIEEIGLQFDTDALVEEAFSATRPSDCPPD